jgi:ankyrin repeat protein
MLQQLPTELLLWICQYLDVAAIQSLCLVCRTFSPLFQEALLQTSQIGGKPPLWRAISHGNVNIATKIIARSKPDINAVYRGRTALDVAIQRYDKIAIDFLLLQPTIRPNLSHFSGLNMLSSAAEKGDLGLVERLLLFPKIDINCQDCRGMTPAMHAVVSGEFSILQLLLSDERMDANITDRFGQTLLHFAALKADTVSIQILVRHARVDVNCQNLKRQTPLHLAASQAPDDKSGKAARSLLDSARVDINARDIHGRTPLWHAVESCRDDVVDIILQRPNVDLSGDQDSVAPLMLAVQKESESIMRSILRHPKFSILVADRASNFPMWEACRLGNENLVRELLRWNVIDINEVGPTGTSPLQVAIIGQHMPIVRQLLGQGDRVAVNHQGPQEWSALTFAAAAGHCEIVKLLLGHPRVDVNHPDDLWRRPLWWATHGNHGEVMRLLLGDLRVQKGHRLRELRTLQQ